MAELKAIPLDTDWNWHYESPLDNAPLNRQQHLEMLADWSPGEALPGRRVVFTRAFWLEPLDACVRYVLHIEAVPGATTIMLSGNVPVGDGAGGPLAVDVTEHVALEANTLVLRLDMSTLRAGERLGRVWLEATPCEE